MDVKQAKAAFQTHHAAKEELEDKAHAKKFDAAATTRAANAVIATRPEAQEARRQVVETTLDMLGPVAQAMKPMVMAQVEASDEFPTGHEEAPSYPHPFFIASPSSPTTKLGDKLRQANLAPPETAYQKVVARLTATWEELQTKLASDMPFIHPSTFPFLDRDQDGAMDVIDLDAGLQPLFQTAKQDFRRLHGEHVRVHADPQVARAIADSSPGEVTQRLTQLAEALEAAVRAHPSATGLNVRVSDGPQGPAFTVSPLSDGPIWNF